MPVYKVHDNDHPEKRVIVAASNVNHARRAITEGRFVFTALTPSEVLEEFTTGAKVLLTAEQEDIPQ